MIRLSTRPLRSNAASIRSMWLVVRKMRLPSRGTMPSSAFSKPDNDRATKPSGGLPGSLGAAIASGSPEAGLGAGATGAAARAIVVLLVSKSSINRIEPSGIDPMAFCNMLSETVDRFNVKTLRP
ncbi:hypothetical protein D3C81_1714630 [compost metagenome]